MFATLLFAAIQGGAGLPPRATVQRAVERLDMSSFPNSLRGVAGDGKAKTLRRLGDFRFEWEDGMLQVTEADGS